MTSIAEIVRERPLRQLIFPAPAPVPVQPLLRQLWLFDPDYLESVGEFKKRFLQSQLRKHRGSEAKAAARLGVERDVLSRQLAETGIDVGEFKRKPVKCVPAKEAWRRVAQ